MFQGFDIPRENWSRLPHSFIDALPFVETIGELKVILYVLRHTWGFQDDYKKLTLDEFEHGRKRRDGSRFDNGTGLSRPTIRNGIERAICHGFITVETDDSDKGRVKKYYALNMAKDSQPGVKKLTPKEQKDCPRTEKDTPERNLKDTPTAAAVAPTPANLEEWLAGAEKAKNRSAYLRWYVVTLFPYFEPDLNEMKCKGYGRVGGVARQIGGMGYCMKLLWLAAGQRITGDPLRYITEMKKNGSGGDNGRGKQTQGGRSLEDYGPDEEIQPGVTRAMAEAAQRRLTQAPAPANV
jgi:hypothetical protein